MSPFRLFVIDARALVPLMIFLVHWSLLTLKIAFVGVAIFGGVEFAGVRFAAAFRIIRGWIYGSVRPARRSSWKRYLA
ncbi:MAG: IcmT/TraK family protein [Acidiphilium sp.]|nr:IcmT/TraK family protein [Acidiphilium sp.]